MLDELELSVDVFDDGSSLISTFPFESNTFIRKNVQVRIPKLSQPHLILSNTQTNKHYCGKCREGLVFDAPPCK
jgi:hypothetical protein